jgi:hypothetical protein
MATAAVTNIVKQIKKLSPAEQQELRTALGTLLPLARLQATEEDFRRALIAAGLLSSPAPEARARAVRRRPFKPVPVCGKPVSETLIEERR